MLKSFESYLVRAEMIALHEADARFDLNPRRGAQFYPACIQLHVAGDGQVELPSGVSFPGAYKYSDPGVHYDVSFSSQKKVPQNAHHQPMCRSTAQPTASPRPRARPLIRSQDLRYGRGRGPRQPRWPWVQFPGKSPLLAGAAGMKTISRNGQFLYETV